MLLYLRWPSLFMFTKCFANFFTKSSKSSKFRLKESTSMQALEMPKSLRFLKTKNLSITTSQLTCHRLMNMTEHDGRQLLRVIYLTTFSLAKLGFTRPNVVYFTSSSSFLSDKKTRQEIVKTAV